MSSTYLLELSPWEASALRTLARREAGRLRFGMRGGPGRRGWEDRQTKARQLDALVARLGELIEAIVLTTRGATGLRALRAVEATSRSASTSDGARTTQIESSRKALAAWLKGDAAEADDEVSAAVAYLEGVVTKDREES